MGWLLMTCLVCSLTLASVSLGGTKVDLWERRIPRHSGHEVREDGDCLANQLQVPKGCSSAAGECTVVLSWELLPEGKELLLAITADLSEAGGVTKHGSWAAVGFSPDGRMAKSDALECLFHASGNVSVLDGWNTKDSQNTVDPNQSDISFLNGSLEGESGQCRFKRAIAPKDTLHSYNLNRTWHLLFAIGPLKGGESEEGATPLSHHKWTWNGAEGVNLLSLCVSPSANDEQSWRAVLIRVHGSLMLFVFLVLFPMGALLARYFKEIVGKKWIYIHMGIMISAAVAMIVSFGFALGHTSLEFHVGVHVCLLVHLLVLVLIEYLQWKSAYDKEYQRVSWKAEDPRASNPESPVSAVKAVNPEAGPVDAVKAYIGSDYGISLKAANGKYLSRVYRGKRQAIDAAKQVKDPCTRFEASVVNGKLVLKADNGKYLSRIYRNAHYLEAEKKAPDVFCQFRVLSVGKGLIALQGENRLYVSRIQRGRHSSIEVVKEGIDDECKFMPGIGDLIPPTFEILNITWDESATLVIYKPTVVMSDTFNNGGSNPIEHNFTLSWEGGSTHTTTWKNAWGVEFNYTFRTGLLGTVVAKHEFAVQLSYNGEYGTNSSVEHTSKFERKIVLQAAAQKKTVAKLVVKKADDVAIPFTAKIKCTKGDGTVKIFEEEGTWHGVAYHSALVDVEELPLDNAY